MAKCTILHRNFKNFLTPAARTMRDILFLYPTPTYFSDKSYATGTGMGFLGSWDNGGHGEAS